MEKVSVVGSFAEIKERQQNELAKVNEYATAKISSLPKFGFTALVVLGGLFLVGMIGAKILVGIAALLATGAFLLFSAVSVFLVRQFDEPFRRMIRNRRLEMMYDEVRKHSTEQLDNHVLIRTDQLKAAKDARDKIGGMVENLRSTVSSVTSDSMREKMTRMLTKVEAVYENSRKSCKIAESSLSKFKAEVQAHKQMDRFTTQIQSILKLYSESAASEIENMLSLEAFETIDTEFNTAIIAVENAAEDAAREE